MEPGDGKSNNSTHRYTSAQVKLVLTFCANGVSNVINYSLYSVVLKKEDTYSQALEHYFNCESTGVEFGKSCDRSAFEALDASPITFPLSTIVYILSPLATLIYVANIDKFTKKYCKAKLRRRKQFQMHVLRKQLSQHSWIILSLSNYYSYVYIAASLHYPSWILHTELEHCLLVAGPALFATIYTFLCMILMYYISLCRRSQIFIWFGKNEENEACVHGWQINIMATMAGLIKS